MSEPTTIFGRIVAGEVPCDKVYEDDLVLAFRDVAPVAPVHVLIIPKKPLARLDAAQVANSELLGHLLWTAAEVARRLNVASDGYRIVINNGEEAGQSVDHLHLHLLAGRPLAWPPG